MNLLRTKRYATVRPDGWKLLQRGCAAWVISSLSLSSIRAQTSPEAQSGRAVQQAVLQSAGLFAANNIAEAEQVLLTTNRSRVGTVLWNVESAHLLIRAASECSSRGNGALALQIAGRAIYHLDKAAQRATGEDRGALASAHELAGFIYERFVGDVASAKARYLAATALAPNLGSAREALARLTIADQDATMKSRAQ